MIPFGSTMKTARTVLVLPPWMRPSFSATSPVSAMMGNSILTPRFSSIHSSHLMWEKTWSTLSPINSVFSALNWS